MTSFQELRRKGIGASDTAAILRLSEWGTPYSVAVEKIMGTTFEESEPMKWGKIMEPILLEEFRQRMSRGCVAANPFWKHPDHDFIFANCDGVADKSARPAYVVEAKISRWGEGFGPDGTDEIPDKYNIQVHHQMACTGARIAYLVVLLGGSNLRIYRIDYNEEIVKAMIPILCEFWKDFVLARRFPEPDFEHPATAEVIRQSVKLDAGRVLSFPTIDEPLYGLCGRYELMRKVEKLAKSEKDSLKSQIRVQSQGAGRIEFIDGTTVTTTMTKRRAYQVKEGEYETMRLTWKGEDQYGISQKLTGLKPLEIGDNRQGDESPNFE